MSISICPHCDRVYDEDYEVEHPDMCKDEFGDTTWEAVEDEAKDYGEN
jgi:hypothetical protein